MKRTHYLVLKNADKLNESQTEKLKRFLESNANINTLYIMREQLQALWKSRTDKIMQKQLKIWCQMADQPDMILLE
jgi:ribosome biogenesis GTPase A